MVEITRPTTVQRGIPGAIVRGKQIGVKATITKITRPGPKPKPKAKRLVTEEKYEGLGYIKKTTPDNLIEYRAPKTVRYVASYDKDAPRGTKKSYGQYNPGSVFVDIQGNIVKEVSRGVFKRDVGGGYQGTIYDSNVVKFGETEGHKTREEKSFRILDDKVLPYQTNFYVDKQWVGRDWGSYAAKRVAEKQKASDVLQQKRLTREEEKILGKPRTGMGAERYTPSIYKAPLGAYDFSGVRGKDTERFDKELTRIFKMGGQPKSFQVKQALQLKRFVDPRPRPAEIRRPSWEGISITRPQQPVRPDILPDILRPARIERKGTGIMALPTNIFSNNLSEKIYGIKESKDDIKAKLKKII